MIKVNAIEFSYRRKGKEPLYKDFSLSLEKGNVYGLLGKNGAGKSTLLYLMAGLLFPQKGEICFNGNSVARRLPQTLSEIFIIPEEFELPAVTLSDYIKMYSPFYPKFNKQQMQENLQAFDMEGENINLKALSMGQKKKIFMSFALATNTSLILMDEPTNGLDIPSKSQFRKIITSNMTDEKSIVISTHQVRDIDNVLDHIVIVDNNHLLLNESTLRINERLLFSEEASGTSIPEAIYSQPSVRGYGVVLPNLHKEDSPLDMELLFNATLANPRRMKSIFE